MKQLVLSSATGVWLLLMAATGISWWLGVDHGLGASVSQANVTVLVVLVALFKVRLVMRHFMELQSAHIGLRLAGEAWLVLVGSLILALYFSA